MLRVFVCMFAFVCVCVLPAPESCEERDDVKALSLWVFLCVRSPLTVQIDKFIYFMPCCRNRTHKQRAEGGDGIEILPLFLL